MEKQKEDLTDGKPCSEEEGMVLMQASEKNVRIGKRIAIVHINNWVNGSIQYQVKLEFNNTAKEPTVSDDVSAIISRLFPEEVGE